MICHDTSVWNEICLLFQQIFGTAHNLNLQVLVNTIRRIWILLETDLWGFTCICQSYHITFVRSEFNFCFFGHLNCTASNVDDWWDPQFIPRCIWPLFSCLPFSKKRTTTLLVQHLLGQNLANPGTSRFWNFLGWMKSSWSFKKDGFSDPFET